MVIILDNIRSTYNVGSIFRTADGVGVEKIYLYGITPAPLDRFEKIRQNIAKVSLGAEKTVPWEKIGSASRLIDKLKKDGCKILAVEQSRKSVPYYKSNVKSQLSKVALIFGNEVSGISKPLLKKADKIIEIPMRGAKESLNVSVAAGIILFRMRYS